MLHPSHYLFMGLVLSFVTDKDDTGAFDRWIKDEIQVCVANRHIITACFYLQFDLFLWWDSLKIYATVCELMYWIVLAVYGRVSG